MTGVQTCALPISPDKGAGVAARAATTKGAQTHGQGSNEASEGRQDDSGRGLRPGSPGEDQNAGQAGQEKVILPTHQKFTPSMPTVNPPVAPAPLPQTVSELPQVCGACPSWHRTTRLPFGQCLAAMRALGAAMYTPDLGSCTLPESERAKMGRL